MGLEVADIPTPYERIAGQPFTLEWELAEEGAGAYGTAEDTSDITEVRVTAEKQVERGETAPAAIVWTLGDGEVEIESVTSDLDGQTIDVLRVVEATGLDAGIYKLLVVATRGGNTDWIASATLELTEQP